MSVRPGRADKVTDNCQYTPLGVTPQGIRGTADWLRTANRSEPSS